jgi:hypothetical protein
MKWELKNLKSSFQNWSYVFCKLEEYMEPFLLLIDSKNGFRFKEELGAKP